MTPKELYTSEDGRITVIDVDGVRSLRFNGRLQSSMCGPDGLETIQPYLDFLHLAFAAVPSVRRVLLIGLGGGVFPKRVLHDYPEVHVDVVEIDPVVVDIAYRYFGLPRSERLNVMVDDGRAFLERTHGRYDLIVVDAYGEASMPFTFQTLEFFECASSRLNEGGALEFNMVGVLEGAGSDPFHRFLKGIRQVFGGSYVFGVGAPCGGRSQNIIVIATAGAADTTRLRENIGSSAEGRVQVRGFSSFGERLVEHVALGGAAPYTDATVSEQGGGCE